MKGNSYFLIAIYKGGQKQVAKAVKFCFQITSQKERGLRYTLMVSRMVCEKYQTTTPKTGR